MGALTDMSDPFVSQDVAAAGEKIPESVVSDQKTKVQFQVVQDHPGLRALVQVVLTAAGVAVIWMLGSPQMNYDPETRTQVITLLGALAAAAGAATMNRK